MLTFLFGPKVTRYKKYLTPVKQHITADENGRQFIAVVSKMHAETYRPKLPRFRTVVVGYYIEEINGYRVGNFVPGEDPETVVQGYLEEQPYNRFLVVRPSYAADTVSAH